jgi:general secretion pathway protein C
MAGDRHTQRVLLAITACLLVAFGLARMIERSARTPSGAPVPAPPPAAAGAAAPEAAPAAPPPAPAAAARPADIPHTQLPLRLLATVVADDPSLSLATVADEERGAHAVMGEGQQFGGRPYVVLAAIERGRVLIDNHGVREQLVLVHGGAEPAVSSEVREITPEEREFRRGLARRLRELTDAGEEALGPGERGGLLAEGDVSAAYQDGELVGVQIDGVRAGGLYDRIGLRSGDVVTDIGGVSLADPDAMVKVLEQAFTSERLQLTVDRPGGGATRIDLPTRELGALVAPE